MYVLHLLLIISCKVGVILFTSQKSYFGSGACYARVVVWTLFWPDRLVFL